MLFRSKRSICSEKVSLNDTDKAEEAAKKILNLLKKPEDTIAEFEKALNIFVKAKELFKQKNNKNMNQYLGSQKIMSYIFGAEAELNNQKLIEQEKTVETFTGKVVRIGRDRNGCYYMFISRDEGSIFAHQSFSDKISFSDMQTGKTVIYELSKDNYGRDVAVNLRK